MARRSRFSTPKYALEAFFWNASTSMLGVLPQWALRLVARSFACFAFDAVRIRRKVTLANLKIAFPDASDQERRKLARASYEHAVYGTAEFVRLSRKNALKSPEISIEVIDPHRALDRLNETAVVFTLGHLGSWEFLASYWSNRGIPLAILYKPMHNPILDAEFLRMRQSSNARFIATRLDARQMWRELKQSADEKRALIFLADQDARRDGIFVPFFGKNASTAAGPATLALRLNLPLVPLACVRDGLWKFKVIFGEPIEPLEGGRTAENIARLTQMHAKALEEVVREYPEQYMWFHQRWKSLPRKKKRQ